MSLKSRTRLEKSLLVSQFVTLLVCAFFFILWRVQLIPWATEYGTVAEWVGATAGWAGAIGAIGTIYWGVYSFNAKAATDRRNAEKQQRREAQKVVTTWQTALTRDSDPEEGRIERELLGTVHNFGSGPVRNISVLLDIPSDKRQWSEISGELRQVIPVIGPGGTGIVRFGVRNELILGLWHRMYADGNGLDKDTVVRYVDEHDTRWESRSGVAKRELIDDGVDAPEA